MTAVLIYFVFLDPGHPDFRNFYSTIFVDVTEVTYTYSVDCALDPTGEPVSIINFTSFKAHGACACVRAQRLRRELK